MKNALQLLAPIAILAAGLNAQATEFKIDTAHSKAGFGVKHMMISTVEGQFKDFDGTFEFDPAKGTLGNSKFEAKTASIDTGNAKRDEHLRTADFFDAEKYPTITITNSKIKKAGKDKYDWTGDLTMHGVTKPVKLMIEYKGMIKDPYGNNRAGFLATGKIARKDWGLTWNKNLDGGGLVVSDEVQLKFDVEATEVKPEAAAPAEKK